MNRFDKIIIAFLIFSSFSIGMISAHMLAVVPLYGQIAQLKKALAIHQNTNNVIDHHNDIK